MPRFAPDTTLLALRLKLGEDQVSDEVTLAQPIDAKEMIASGAYVLADTQPGSVAPTTHRKAPADSKVLVRDIAENKILQVHAIDAKEMCKEDRYERYTPPVVVETAPAEGEQTEAQLPAIEELATFLATIDNAETLLEMETRDERPEAKPLYEARFDELARSSARQ